MESAAKFYNFLLLFYPKEYRQKYAQQMLIVFKDLYRDHLETYGNAGFRFWFLIFVDSFSTIIEQHLLKLKIRVTNKFFLTAAAITLLTFPLTFFLTSLGVWIYNNYTFGGGAMFQNLNSFSNKYRAILENKIFETTFSMAENCITITDKVEQQLCKSTVGRKIGETLHEEELSSKYNDWPVDLVFVKQTNEKFYRLGWEGELKDITHLVDKNAVSKEQSDLSFLLKHNCRNFQVWMDNKNSCEVYSTIDLKNGTGYLVRIYPFTEDTSFWYSFVMPIFGVFYLFNIRTSAVDWNDLPFALLSFLNIIIPMIVTFIVLYIFIHIEQSKKKK